MKYQNSLNIKTKGKTNLIDFPLFPSRALDPCHFLDNNFEDRDNNIHDSSFKS